MPRLEEKIAKSRLGAERVDSCEMIPWKNVCYMIRAACVIKQVEVIKCSVSVHILAVSNRPVST